MKCQFSTIPPYIKFYDQAHRAWFLCNKKQNNFKKKFRIAAIVGLPGFDRDTYVLSSLRNFKLSQLGNEGKKN